LRYPDEATLREIGRRSVEAEVAPTPVVSLDEVRSMRRAVRQVRLTRAAAEHAARTVLATHPGRSESVEAAGRYVRYGASPRGAQALVLVGKVHSLLAGRTELQPQDIDAARRPCLRHRIILNFEGGIEGMTPEVILDQIAQSESSGL
jgi:MoxR-like ATPase